MANDSAFHEKTGQRLRLNQALKLVAQGQIVWVEFAKVWRNATRADLPQILAARAEEARKQSPLSGIELPGIKFVPPASAKDYQSAHPHILRETAQWCEEAQASL